MNIGAGIGIGFAEPRGVLAFEYEQSSGCQNGSDITPVINTPGGTFDASPTGLSINSSTGVIDVSASTAGTYTVTYSIGPTEDTITIQAADDATFSYSASSFPQDGSNPTPTITGLSGGTFSAGSGLVFVDSSSNTGSSTGQINLSASTIASYTITYTTSGSCPNTSTFAVAVTAAVPALAQINNVYSMEFDPVSSQYIDVDEYVFSGLTSLSISCWYNLNSISGDQAILAQYIEAPTNRGILLYHDDPNGWAFYINTDAGLKSFESTFTATASVWQHLVVTYESGVGIKIYLNGTAQSSGTLSGTTVNPTPSEFTIGRDGASGSFTRFLNGKLDELGIFNTALTQDQVSSIYNATEIVSGVNKTADLSQLTTPPVKWYRMGD